MSALASITDKFKGSSHGVLNVLRADGSGSVDKVAGTSSISLPLASYVFLTQNTQKFCRDGSPALAQLENSPVLGHGEVVAVLGPQGSLRGLQRAVRHVQCARQRHERHHVRQLGRILALDPQPDDARVKKDKDQGRSSGAASMSAVVCDKLPVRQE
mgnify:CR=1 FL=1